METPEQWLKIKAIVGEALERDAPSRPSYLDGACGADRSLRARVESLLAAYQDSDGLSVVPGVTPGHADAALSIGPYRLIRELGAGGMGQVWLAEQTHPVRRRVALKLIKAGMYDAFMVQRFQSERQSLAIMDHPAIAKVFDAGATASGQPYFVMEYVDGPPINDYCSGKNLNVRERVRLFIQVCEGVQHAHQKAVIHRDLKPSNILVVEVDRKPMPRIIDFGLAKAAQPANETGTVFMTQVGAFVGTPGYMSPEQADPIVQDVDTRTDIYSLGVVLYDLLTGSLPFDTSQWKKHRFEEVLRQLREDDPPLPSTRTPAPLAGKLRGDLDWITLKALEKDRERRYVSAAALAADLDRYLQDLPVEAQPASTAYRVRKYVKRNVVKVVAAAVVTVLLIAFAVAQTLQLRRITRERDRADRIGEFMTSMFQVSDPSEARGNTITAREILDKSSIEIGTRLAQDPELQARLFGTMGQVYTNLGLYPKAQQTLEGAVAAVRRVGSSDSALAFDSTNLLSYVLIQQGKPADAEKLMRQTAAREERVLGPDHPATLTGRRYLAFALHSQGKYDEAGKIQRDVLARMRRRLGSENRETLLAINQMANIAQNEGNLPAAEKLYREVMTTSRRVLGPQDPIALLASSNLANLLRDEGKRLEAEHLLRELLETKRRILGPEHPQTLTVMDNLAIVLADLGRNEEAEKLFRQTVALEIRVRGPEHPQTLVGIRGLSFLLHSEGNNGEAETLQRRVLESGRRVFGPEHPFTLATMSALAITLDSVGKLGEADRLHVERIEIAGRKTEQALADAWYDYACGANQAGQRDAALHHLRQAIDHGYWDAEQMRIDGDLKTLRGDPRFETLVAEARKRAAAVARKD